MNSMNEITEPTAKKFSLIAGGTALILTALSLPLYFSGAGTLILVDACISFFCGIGIMRGNRFAAVLLLICTLASRYDSYPAASRSFPALLNAWPVCAYILGVTGAFARNRIARLNSRDTDPGWLDQSMAVIFCRASGGAGLIFGAMVGWFSITASGEFSTFNLLDSALILFFAWHTLKGRVWAAALQSALCAVSMVISYTLSSDLHSFFGFIPSLLLQVYLLGVLGTKKIRTGGTPQT